MKKITSPLTAETIAELKAGDEVLLSGVIYTARDQAHLRLSRMIQKGETLPVDFTDQVIYYCGPTPSIDRVIGACGPTTSRRMDPFTPLVLEETALKGIIGKGARSAKVAEVIKKTKSVYFVAPAGAGAYLSEKVTSSEVVAFDDLGPEAIYKLEVKDFPLIVAIDSRGNDLYEKFRKENI
jgi:fumarate hydratase subunit beta